MSYTKGPWKYHRSTSYHSIKGSGPCDIARTMNTSHEEREANGRLIAASPEMYECMKWILENAKAISPEGHVHLTGQMQDMIRQCIQKAEGKE